MKLSGRAGRKEQESSSCRTLKTYQNVQQGRSFCGFFRCFSPQAGGRRGGHKLHGTIPLCIYSHKRLWQFTASQAIFKAIKTIVKPDSSVIIQTNNAANSPRLRGGGQRKAPHCNPWSGEEGGGLGSKPPCPTLAATGAWRLGLP